jgi:hypothetical protein
MTLRLASSGDDRALAIRDHILPLLREYGTLEVQRDTVRVVELRIGAWTFRHWTPFNDLAPGEASLTRLSTRGREAAHEAGFAIRARRVSRGTGAERPVGR